MSKPTLLTLLILRTLRIRMDFEEHQMPCDGHGCDCIEDRCCQCNGLESKHPIEGPTLDDLVGLYPNITSLDIHCEWLPPSIYDLEDHHKSSQIVQCKHLKTLSINLRTGDHAYELPNLVPYAATILETVETPALEEITIRLEEMDAQAFVEEVGELEEALCQIQSSRLVRIKLRMEALSVSERVKDCLWVSRTRPDTRCITNIGLHVGFRRLWSPSSQPFTRRPTPNASPSSSTTISTTCTASPIRAPFSEETDALCSRNRYFPAKTGSQSPSQRSARQNAGSLIFRSSSVSQHDMTRSTSDFCNGSASRHREIPATLGKRESKVNRRSRILGDDERLSCGQPPRATMGCLCVHEKQFAEMWGGRGSCCRSDQVPSQRGTSPQDAQNSLSERPLVYARAEERQIKGFHARRWAVWLIY
jgi:hypothetical protein